GVQRRKDDVRRDLRGIAREHGHVRDARRQFVGADPSRRVRIAPPRRALRRGDFDELEPRMLDEQADERLTDRAGGAEHRDSVPASLFPGVGNAFPRLALGHDASKLRTIFSYAPTAPRNSFTSMNSFGVCAT